ncbi:MAG: hypothetical protein Q8P52_00115 [bacterium]|nr:hypothetical protein [bacterium]
MIEWNSWDSLFGVNRRIQEMPADQTEPDPDQPIRDWLAMLPQAKADLAEFLARPSPEFRAKAIEYLERKREKIKTLRCPQNKLELVALERLKKMRAVPET